MSRLIFLTALLVVFFIPKIVSANIVINEIMYNLEGSDSGREWIEIFNNSSTAVDLTGWKFYENETNHKLTIIQGEANLPPNGYAVITDKPDKFLTDNPNYSGTLFDSTFSLNNSGESLALKDSDLVVVDEMTYDSSWGADGDGKSLQKKDPEADPNQSTNWGTGDPTPGTINNISPEEPAEEPISPEESTEGKATTPPSATSNNPPIADAGDNIIAFIGQEIKFDGSNSSDPDGDELAFSWNMGDGKLIEEKSFTYKYLYPGIYLVTLRVYDGQYYVSDTITVKIQSQQITINEFIPNPVGKDEESEWIEIYNDSDSIVNISGWQLDDMEDGSKPFVFPENTLIAPKSYLVFSRQITGIALNNDKDSVRLLLPEGVVFQEVNYEKPKEGQSSARTPDGFVWSLPTPGMPNLVGIAVAEASSTGSKQIIYQQPIEPETTKEPAQNYALEYNKPEQEIKGGYVFSAKPQQEPKKQENPSQLATVKQPLPKSAKQNSVNLILFIVIIVLAALLIGLFLTKFRKKFP